jgi:hypothetical protein
MEGGVVVKKDVEYEKYITQDRKTRQIKLVIPTALRQEIYAELFEEGWEITSQGPYSDPELFPKVDMKRYIIHAVLWVDE